MNREIWQQLLSLENRDITQKWFYILHRRKLNTRRTKEINSAAKQSREYFRNASNSNFSVRPLLTYYGVASLSRAFLLLLRKESGEEGLKSGHGLRTIDWGEILSGNSPVCFSSYLNLEVQTCTGLFYDFIKETENRISIHVSSSSVDWHLSYDIPDQGNQVSLGDLFSRLPDLFNDYSRISSEIRYAHVKELSYDQQNGFKAKVRHEHFDFFQNTYKIRGYKIETQDKWSTLTCELSIFEKNLPLFSHSYDQKTFGSIPNLHIAEPFSKEFNYSQLCVTFLTAYFLGMLCRYFPTQWISLIHGEKGDALWPTLNRAQHCVENSFPELVIEMIFDKLKEKSKQ